MKNKINDLLFDVRRSVRYHRHRQRFFTRLHVITTAGSLFMGASVVASILANHQTLALYAGAFVAALSAIDLIVGFSNKIRLHSDLARRFINLESEIITLSDAASSNYDRLYASRLSIEADEPPILRVLDSLCYNEMLRAEGYDKNEYVQISSTQKIFSNWFDYRQDTIQKNN